MSGPPIYVIVEIGGTAKAAFSGVCDGSAGRKQFPTFYKGKTQELAINYITGRILWMVAYHTSKTFGTMKHSSFDCSLLLLLKLKIDTFSLVGPPKTGPFRVSVAS